MPASPLPAPVERLIEALSRLPGVGPRTAERLASHLLRTPIGDAAWMRMRPDKCVAIPERA